VTSLDHQFEDDMSARASEDREVEFSSKWLDRLSVEKKLGFAVLGNTLVLAFLVTLILFAAWFFTETGREHSISNAVEARSNNAVVALYDAIESVDTAENAASQAQRNEALVQSNEALTLALALLNEPIAEAQFSLPDDYSETYLALRDDVQALQRQIDASRGTNARLTELRVEIMETRNGLKDFTAFLRTRMKSSTAALFGEITTFLLVLVVISAGCIGGSIFGARKIASRVSFQIKELTSTMEKIVDGDTSTEIPSRQRQDEIGGMARALEVFRRSSLELSELTQKRAAEVEAQLAQQQFTAEEMRALRQQKSQLLEDLAKGFEVSVGELITSVSAASEQLKATSAQMVKVAHGSSEQADSASAAMKNASSNVTAAAAATDEFALSINEISQQATASATLARDATALVASANTRMDDLSSAAEEVGEIAGLIQTIAQRTNLLALNASIEAARGGEAGRGFAVVASEVKELAMQTSAATSSVAEKITAMQDSTRSSAGDLTSIYDQIGELEKVAVVIATAVDQQSVSGEELARNIDTVAEGSRQVSERLVALREASEETGSAAGDVVDSANALGSHANDLREKAGRFIADVRKSARELEADEKAA
jgi:methyl-accepting chemotaxis protein